VSAVLGALCLALALPMPRVMAQEACETYRITGYVRGHHSPWTYDGTSVWTREPIAAASWNVPIDTHVEVDGVGTFRVADRGGGLGARHIDILVDSVSEAYALTSWRQVCLL
jgi:3D (Asp-Asp-Asp) domain-containing protein